MKKLFFISLMFIGVNAFAQEYREETQSITPTYIQVDETLYQVIIKNDGVVQQTGYYESNGNDLVKTGIWKMFSSKGRVITTAEFKDNKLVWIKSNDVKYTYQDIEVKRLRNKVRHLEQQLYVVGTN
jgi:hypothetical protein